MLNYRRIFEGLTRGWIPDAEPQNGGLPAYTNYRVSQRDVLCVTCLDTGVVLDPKAGTILCPDCNGGKRK
jgi:hypothetical protein